MKLYGVALAAVVSGALLLVGCGSADKPAASPSTSASSDAEPELPVVGNEVRIVALGDSLFAGYGLKPGESYPAQLESALRAKGVNARIVNAGVSGDTTAAGLQRMAFVLDSQPSPPQFVILCFGGNDMLRGLSPQQTRANLDAMLTELNKRGIPVLLMGMLAAPNLGEDYRRAFDPIYPELAKKHGAALVPFFLQPLMGKPDLVQADHMHPTKQGVEELVAATTGEVAKKLPKETVR